jgi:signal transduction histidine kinase
MSKSLPLVLIIDDDATARYTLETHLIRQAYELAFLDSGSKVFAYLEDNLPDVILLDVMMPGLDGFEICRRLKAQEQWKHIPIILITALSGKEQVVRGLDAGADEFLFKPVSGPELRARVRSMLRIKSQYDELQAMLLLREELSQMIVHDMRNPLTRVLMYSELLLFEKLSSATQQKVKMIHTAARQLDSFINDLLLQAKLESDRFVLHQTPVDMNQLALKAINDHEPLAQGKNIKLAVESPQASRDLLLDATLFSRVLDNLLSNAIKFSLKNTKVTLRIEYPDVEKITVRIQVLDEGPGIPPEYHESIFNKFEVITLKNRNLLQVGLGLAFCKMVVDAHGGNIFVEDNQPVGSVFIVEI